VDESCAFDVLQRLADRRLDAHAIDVTHREDPGAELPEQRPLALVQGADADERSPTSGAPWPWSLDQIWVFEADPRGPVDRCGRRDLGQAVALEHEDAGGVEELGDVARERRAARDRPLETPAERCVEL